MDEFTIDYVISQVWALIGLVTLLQNLLPAQLLQWLKRRFFCFQERFNNYYELNIPEFCESQNYSPNRVYQDVDLYIATLDFVEDARKVIVHRGSESSDMEFDPATEEVIQDSFNGATMRWSRHVQIMGQKEPFERRSFSLETARSNESLLSAYFDHIEKAAVELKKEMNETNIYTNYQNGCWRDCPFRHPSTFASLALDLTTKKKIIEDLDGFKKGKEFHNRVGRAWKRGYLLYGPPGTGKTSLVAAIANYMKYHVYVLDLARVTDNFQLRKLFLMSQGQSIIVIEDIDCSLDLTDRLSPLDPYEQYSESRVTLSGVLNFTDGLLSGCDEERIIIFTTNNKDRLDPALLRCGRMDMHIFLSFCSFSQFKSLAFNYLQVEDHPLFSIVEKSMRETGAEITPAEISEILINHLDDPVKALNAVISTLNDRVNSTFVKDSEEEITEIIQDGVRPSKKKSTQTKLKGLGFVKSR